MVAGISIRKLSLSVMLAACVVPTSLARAQRTSTANAKRIPHKDPTVATVVGFLVPGGGQFYTERYGKAAGVLGGTVAAIAVGVPASHNGQHSIATIAYVSAGLVWAYGWLTAGRDARLFNDQMLHTTIAPFLDRRNGRQLAGFSLSTP